MESNKELSMISDELKPRRTPVPSYFENSIPRPSVPDLSIIETQGNGSTPQAVMESHRFHPFLNHLSYNDWRQKTDGGINHGTSSGRRSQQKGEHQSVPKLYVTQGPVTSVGNYNPVEKLNSHREKVDACPPRTIGRSSGKVVTYSDLKGRPTSAPTANSQQRSAVSVEHPLSKSEPSRRTLNGDEIHLPVSVLSRVNNSASHSDNCTPQTQTGFAYRNPSNVMQQNYSDPRLPHSSDFIPLSNHCIQSNGSKCKINHPYERDGQELSVVQRDHVKNRVQCSCKECLPSSNSLAMRGRDDVEYACRSLCCQPTLRQSHCAPLCSTRAACGTSATNMGPHTATHQVCDIQNNHHPSRISNDDLYNLVLAQNDQLKALQAQVERLLLTREEHEATKDRPETGRKIERIPQTASKAIVNKVSEEGTQTSDTEFREEDECQKMSIGVMTSFIHAVAYRGRVGRLDAMHNVSEHESKVSNGNHGKQSRSESSDGSGSNSTSSTSRSSKSHQKHSKSTKHCCKDCSFDGKADERTKKHFPKNDRTKKLSSNSNEGPSHTRMLPNSEPNCSEGCNCNNPGVSAAITAVRSCQAVLESRTGMGMHDFSTFNGADLPTVTEQPMSPLSSIHVDLHDYHSSSSDEETHSSQSNGDIDSDEDDTNVTKDNNHGSKHNGWTFYNNVLGQVNRILEDRDLTSSPSGSDLQQVVAVPSPKKTDVSVSKRVAFEGSEGNEPPKNLKELALRYLKENYPEELAASAPIQKSRNSCRDKMQEKTLYNPPASNMSFATFRYLERYNLLPENFNPQQYLEASANIHVIQGKHGNSLEPQSSPIDKRLHKGGRKLSKLSSGKHRLRTHDRPIDHAGGGYQPIHQMNIGHQTPYGVPPYQALPKNVAKSNTPTSKILDITTLKQQPKLL